eukprot:gene4333-5328_t
MPFESEYFRYPSRISGLVLACYFLVYFLEWMTITSIIESCDYANGRVDHLHICVEFDHNDSCTKYECAGDIDERYYVGSCGFYEDVQTPLAVAGGISAAVAGIYTVVSVLAMRSGFKKLALEIRTGRAPLPPHPHNYRPTQVTEMTGNVLIGVIFGFAGTFFLVFILFFALSFQAVYGVLWKHAGYVIGLVIIPLLLDEYVCEDFIWSHIMSQDHTHPHNLYVFGFVDMVFTVLSFYK